MPGARHNFLEHIGRRPVVLPSSRMGDLSRTLSKNIWAQLIRWFRDQPLTVAFCFRKNAHYRSVDTIESSHLLRYPSPLEMVFNARHCRGRQHRAFFSFGSVMKNQVIKQGGTGGSSASQNTATGSGSRPKGGKFPIPSSNPASAQMIRPKNKMGK